MGRLASPLPAAALLLAGLAAGAASEGARTLAGTYRSGFGDGAVRATFTPDGDRLWKVRFDFTFNGRSRVYRGTAEGSLDAGNLAGRVENEFGRRTFTFRGEIEDGVFLGTHAEIVRGREKPTGTLVLEE